MESPALILRRARVEGRNRDRIAERVHVHHGFMVAKLARYRERAHAVRPHVGERAAPMFESGLDSATSPHQQGSAGSPGGRAPSSPARLAKN